jgi:hypothetical protein
VLKFVRIDQRIAKHDERYEKDQSDNYNVHSSCLSLCPRGQGAEVWRGLVRLCSRTPFCTKRTRCFTNPRLYSTACSRGSGKAAMSVPTIKTPNPTHSHMTSGFITILMVAVPSFVQPARIKYKSSRAVLRMATSVVLWSAAR